MASGQTTPQAYYFALLDHYGAVVCTDSVSRAILQSLTNASDIQIRGTIEVFAVAGIFNFSEFEIAS